MKNDIAIFISQYLHTLNNLLMIINGKIEILNFKEPRNEYDIMLTKLNQINKLNLILNKFREQIEEEKFEVNRNEIFNELDEYSNKIKKK